MMEIIQETLMQWGEAMNLFMENRSLFYSPVLKHWRVKKWAGKNAKGLIYDGDDLTVALEHLLGPNAAKHTPRLSSDNSPAEGKGYKPANG
jgi:hypothetical protein